MISENVRPGTMRPRVGCVESDWLARMKSAVHNKDSGMGQVELGRLVQVTGRDEVKAGLPVTGTVGIIST
jgi:hypothetical protein